MRLSKTPRQLDEYGEESLEVLLQHFGKNKTIAGGRFKAIVDGERVKMEYMTLKKQVLKEYALENWDPRLTATERCVKVWGDIEKSMGSDVPNMLSIAHSLLIAQPHCVDNERLHGFRKLLESDKRGMLKRETVDVLLRMMWNSPDLCSEEAEDFYRECVKEYLSGNRRFR